MSDRICIVDLSQPIHAAPLERVCAVEVQAHATSDDVVVFSHAFMLAIAVSVLFGVLTGVVIAEARRHFCSWSCMVSFLFGGPHEHR